jgi:hypothetical protein
MTRKRGVYYYRRRLPKPFSGEIALSLRTKVFLQADWLSQRLNSAFERVLQQMKDTDNKRVDVAEIAKQYLREALKSDLLVRQRQAGQVPATGWFKWASSVDAVEDELDAARAVLAGRRAFNRPEIIEWLMDKHGVPEDQRQELTFAILRAEVAKWETIRKRTLGEPDGFEALEPVAPETPTISATGSKALLAEGAPRLKRA